MVRRPRCLAGGLLVLAGLAAPAAGQVPSDSILQLNEIVVTVSRTEQRVAEVPSYTTVLTRRDIERSPARTLDDLLRQVPGFNLLFQTGSVAAHPTTQTVSLRGLGGSAASRTLVLLDGIPLNDPFVGWVPWSMVPLESVERIEIVRGGGAGIWGNLALGGVIHIITKQPRERSLALSLEGGGQSTLDVQAAATERRGPLGVALRGRRFGTDGYPTILEEQRGAVDTSPDLENVAFGAKLDYRLSPGRRLFFNGSVYSEDRGSETRYQNNATDIVLLHGGAELATAGGGTWRLGTFAWLQDHENLSSSTAPDRNSETPALNQFDVPATSLGASATWAMPLGSAHRVSAGADVQWIDAEVNEDFQFADGSFQRRRRTGGSRLLGGVFVHDAATLAPGLELLSSGRIDFWRDSGGARTVHDLSSGEVVEDETFSARNETTLNGNVGLRFAVTPGISLRGSAYRGFRAPTLSELYKPFRAAGNVVNEANESLRPERLVGVDGGLDWAPSPRLLLRVTGFWNRLEDPIYQVTIEEAGPTGRPIAPCGFVPAGGVCRQRRNLDAARARGVETEVDLRPHPSWRFSASHLYDQTEVVSAPEQPDVEGKWIRQAPRHQLAAVGEYDAPERFDLTVRGRYVGKRFDDDLNTLEVDDFFVADLRIGRRLSERLHAHVSVGNLLDTTAEVSRATNGLVRADTPRLVQVGLDAQF
jgi:outer membrane cobalamin receptor